MNSEYLKIGEALKQLIEPKAFDLQELPEQKLPLFLLVDAEPDLVAFASIDGQPEEDYKRALETFKGLYADFADKWADRDLTLVICTHSSSGSLSSYWNQIELDKYFCRKFVIDLNRDLAAQLGRFPFVPLNPQTVVGLARPLSVQTLLRKKHGLEAWLAESLAVPGQSPESIVEQCLRTPIDVVLKNLPLDSFVGSPVAEQPRVRIKEIGIKNFRAYCNQRFDFSADVIVLYGPNGLGKTSLFDALDFLCTGGISRFDERSGKNKQKQRAALTRLGSTPAEAQVNAILSIHNKELRIERRVSDASTASVDGVSVDRKNTLAKLVNLPKNTKMDLRVENFVRLFRATHLFGQDSASLTCDIHDESMLSEETVARMLAFQDYVEAINKSKKVSGEINGRLEGQDSQQIAIADSLKIKRTELKKLTNVARDLEAPDAVLRKGYELASEIARTGGIEVEVPSEITLPLVHGWRGLLEGELHSIGERLEMVKEAQNQLPRRAEAGQLLDKLPQEFELKTRQLEDALSSLTRYRQQLYELESERNLILEEQKRVSGQADSIRWLLSNSPEYQRLKGDTKKIDDQLEIERPKISQMNSSYETAAAELNLIDGAIRQTQEQIQSDEKVLSEINGLLDVIEGWRQGLERLEELNTERSKENEKADIIQEEINTLTSELQEASIAADAATKLLSNLQRTQSELHTLLDNLAHYVSGETCPLCGTVHESKEDLLRLIDRQRGTQTEAMGTALRAVESTKLRVQSLQQSLDARRQSLTLIVLGIRALEEERDRLKAVVEQYAGSALALGITTTTPELCGKAATTKATVFSERLTQNREQFGRQLILAEEKQALIAAESERRNQAIQEVTGLESQRRAAADSLLLLQTQALDLNLLFENVQDAARELEFIAKDLAKKTGEATINQEESAKIRREVTKLQAQAANHEKEVRVLRSQIDAARKTIPELEQLFARIELESNITADALALTRSQLEQKQLILQGLRDRVIDFEIAMDAAQTQAALAKTQAEIASLQKDQQEAIERVRGLTTLRTYFDKIHEALRDVQQALLDEYVVKYGPLASTIQQRLRPVYGFGGLKLHAQKGGIAVTVERDGEQYRPSDYFSESQLQIVMLSLFLSAVLTQTWSSLGLVLLDDPVTHFDDLNAYALLDVIRGVVETSGSGHQFIVSTCEERLYRLMRQRFSKTTASVAFYEFQSIGESGPVILSR